MSDDPIVAVRRIVADALARHKEPQNFGEALMAMGQLYATMQVIEILVRDRIHADIARHERASEGAEMPDEAQGGGAPPQEPEMPEPEPTPSSDGQPVEGD